MSWMPPVSPLAATRWPSGAKAELNMRAPVGRVHTRQLGAELRPQAAAEG